ncbi:MAG: esterase family protein [Saprospiraceae bacterium]
MNKEHLKWHSPTIGKEMEMFVYGHSGYPVIIFPTTMGRYYESTDFGLIDAAKWYLDEGKIKIYCVDSIDKQSWYNKDIHPAQRVKNHIWYDRFIQDEIVDPIRKNHGFDKVAVSGASFGGYQAANFAFRHPERVSHLFSMSGAFDVKSFLDGYYDENVYFNNPTDYLPDNNNPELWNMDIVLGVGEWDICLEANQKMADILNRKNINYWFDLRRWAKHDWPLWEEMFPHYLSRLV